MNDGWKLGVEVMQSLEDLTTPSSDELCLDIFQTSHVPKTAHTDHMTYKYIEIT